MKGPGLAAKIKFLFWKAKSFKVPKWYFPAAFTFGTMAIIPYFLVEYTDWRHPIMALSFAIGFMGWGIKSLIVNILFVRYMIKAKPQNVQPSRI